MINTNTMKNFYLLCFFGLSFLPFLSFKGDSLENRDSRFDHLFHQTDNSSFTSGPLLGLDDTLRFTINDCGAATDICVEIPIADISSYQITNNGQPYANGIGGCNFDTLNRYDYTSLFGQGAIGPYILQSWLVNAVNFTANFNSIDELVDSLNVWDPTGNWQHNDPDNLITGGTPGNSYSDMVIWSVVINAGTTIPREDDITTNGTLLNFGVGNNTVIVTHNVSGESETVVVLIACINSETIQAQVGVGESDTICLDFSELLGDVNTVTNLCSGSNVQFQLVNNDSCVAFTGLQVGTDTACIETCDVFGFCDTTYFVVNAVPFSGSHHVYDTIFAGESGTHCINTSGFPGTPFSMENICPGNSGLHGIFSLDESTFCVDYTGLFSGGTDMACIVVCDDMSFCDTTTIHLTVRRQGPLEIYDTIFINEMIPYCNLDTNNLDGNINGLFNDCPLSSGTSVFFDPDFDNLCVFYEGIGIGQDTACIHLTDDQGNTDTMYFYVQVVAPALEVVFDTIRVGLTPEYCIDTTELVGTIVSITNECPESSGTYVSFILGNPPFCVQTEGLAVGTDTACIVACDDLGVCDTTIFIITVEENDHFPPEATDDFASMDLNTELYLDVCTNDILPLTLPVTDLYILPPFFGGTGPSNGTATTDDECMIHYIPDNNFCGVDSLTYIICNTLGCDTALVEITVICSSGELRVFNGFSPNGDGVGDSFRIDGLDYFPNHELFIYNRWGNLVFEARNYANDWQGRWEGRDLPDGTYFYVLNDGEGNVLSGHVVIQR